MLILFATAAPGAPAAAGGIEKAKRPSETIPLAGCVTADCHANVKSHKAVHGPVGLNACDACHKELDVKTHTFELRRKGAEVCTFCHEFNVERVPVVHLPVAKGECLGCHNPHGGVDKRFIRETSTTQMCARCHESVVQGRKHVHGPVGKGECSSCHTSHASRFPKLLYAEGDNLCLSCHKDFENQLTAARFQHKALKEGCAKCHESHASNIPKQLKQPIVQMCTSCHEKVAKDAAQARYKHTVVMADRACLTCHTAHGSDLAMLMSDLPIRVCMNCHNDKVKTDRGYVVPAMKELADATTTKHGPINDGQCGACHQVHGSQQQLLLVRTNNNELYQSMAAENYQLCFGCHDLKLGQDQQTRSATAFRNGDLNLHFIHANRGERGRNCKICHNTHASHSPRHVNEVAQFGSWQMPIRFAKTQTGGSCNSGCHPAYAYDRVKPVARPPSTQPVVTPPGTSTTPIIRHEPAPVPEKSPAIGLALTTITGQQLKIPSGDKPTVLVFSRAGHGQQQGILAMLKKAGTIDAQVILILGGEDARVEARRMTNAREVAWPIVPDSKDEIFVQVEVHVWPTTMILRPDGTQAGRIAGAPESLASSLPAYIDFAAGKIDRAALTQRLAAHTTVGDTPARHIARQLETARKLQASGKTAPACQVLAQAMQDFPESAAIQVELVNALIRNHQAPDALQLLKKVPADAMPPGQRDVMLARILLEQKKWTEARNVLAATIKRDPRLAEAHYLAGRIYEQEGDWPQAARSYRTARELEKQQQ